MAYAILFPAPDFTYRTDNPVAPITNGSGSTAGLPYTRRVCHPEPAEKALRVVSVSLFLYCDRIIKKHSFEFYEACLLIKKMRMTTMKIKSGASEASDREESLMYAAMRRSRSVRGPGNETMPPDDGSDDSPVGPGISLSATRREHLSAIRFDVEREMRRLRRLADELDKAVGNPVAASSAGGRLSTKRGVPSVFEFLRDQIRHKRQLGKLRSSETYRATLNSFMRFRKGVDLSFDRIDSRMMELYEADLQGRGLSRNTSSFYLRILRTNYKMAVERGLTPDRRPFKHVYCGMDKTAKRSLSLEEIKRIKALDLSQRPAQDFARDMFIFSFCTRGMSFVDMAYLRKQDLKNGYLIYRRKKTGQLLTVEWTPQMQAILDKHPHPGTQYLLPIIVREDGSERRQYQNQMMRINRRLKDVALRAKLSVPLSLYYSRHSWATIARRKEIPLSVISEGLGHDSESTTQIYLDSIRSFEVDKANRKILRDL